VTGARVARELTVAGRVQGVSFRDSVRRAAERRRVAGWAANRDDGTVQVVLEGAPDDVEEVVAFCRQGPRAADVNEVEVTELEPSGREGFEVRG
jgi:acylphosphatase